MKEINELLKEIEEIFESENYFKMSVLRGSLAILLTKLASDYAKAKKKQAEKWFEIRTQMQTDPNKKISVAEVDRLVALEPISEEVDIYKILFDYSLQVLYSIDLRIKVLLHEKGIIKFMEG